MNEFGLFYETVNVASSGEVGASYDRLGISKKTNHALFSAFVVYELVSPST